MLGQKSLTLVNSFLIMRCPSWPTLRESEENIYKNILYTIRIYCIIFSKILKNKKKYIPLFLVKFRAFGNFGNQEHQSFKKNTIRWFEWVCMWLLWHYVFLYKTRRFVLSNANHRAIKKMSNPHPITNPLMRKIYKNSSKLCAKKNWTPKYVIKYSTFFHKKMYVGCVLVGINLKCVLVHGILQDYVEHIFFKLAAANLAGAKEGTGTANSTEDKKEELNNDGRPTVWWC